MKRTGNRIPKISVVMPLYNKKNSLLRAINSILCQSEQDFELIVVNDGSTDSSETLISDIMDGGARICLINQENAGVSAARNRGVREAHSDLIAFLDADDEWCPEFLETILRLKSQFPEESVFGASYSIQDQTGKLSLPKTTRLFESDHTEIIENFIEIVRTGLPFNSSTFAVAKKALDDIGGFPAGIKFGEDVDVWIRLSLKYKIVYLNKALAIYHQDAENRACELHYPSLEEYHPVKNLARMLRDGKVPAQLRQSAIEYIAKHQLALANSHLYHGNITMAKLLIDTCAGTKIYARKWIVLYMCTFLPPSVLRFLVTAKQTLKS